MWAYARPTAPGQFCFAAKRNRIRMRRRRFCLQQVRGNDNRRGCPQSNSGAFFMSNDSLRKPWPLVRKPAWLRARAGKRAGHAAGSQRADPVKALLAGQEKTAVLRLLASLSGLPLRIRRRLLRMGWRLSLLVRRDVGFGLEPFLGKHLRLGALEARHIAREHDFHDMLQILEWFSSGRRSKSGLIADSNFLRLNGADLIERLADSGESVILAPMHMGVYPIGISYVIWKYFPGRRVLVLRAREDDEENNAAMDRLREIASEVRILNTRNETEFMEAMRFARKGAVVISMIDLPETYGSPVETVLFGQAARIAFGMDAMARMLKAVVLPMTVRSGVSGDEIDFGQPFEVWKNTEEDRQLLAVQFGRQIEGFVALDPCQWHMWTRIVEFFPPKHATQTPDPIQQATDLKVNHEAA